jgi:hypothetical protein
MRQELKWKVWLILLACLWEVLETGRNIPNANVQSVRNFMYPCMQPSNLVFTRHEKVHGEFKAQFLPEGGGFWFLWNTGIHLTNSVIFSQITI